jgi:hypothetical protein
MGMVPLTEVPKARATARRRRQRGNEFVEFALVLMPLFGMIFVYLDMSWAIFVKATLEQALRMGVRYGITNQVPDPNQPGLCSGTNETLSACITEHVQYSAGGLLAGPAGASLITVSYWAPNSSGTLTQVTGTGANFGGNVVAVSIGKITIGSTTVGGSPFNLAMLVPTFVNSGSQYMNFTLCSADTLTGVTAPPPE